MPDQDFTEAARAEAEKRWPRVARRNKTAEEWLDEGMASGFVLGAQWSAAQGPTEENLDAALLAFLTAENLAVIPGISRERAEEYAREERAHGAERVREALRAALSVPPDETRRSGMADDDLPFRCRRCGGFVGQQRLQEADDFGPKPCKRCHQEVTP